MADKPEWVKALEEAAVILQDAKGAQPVEMDAKTRLAYCWIDIARIYKEVSPSLQNEKQDLITQVLDLVNRGLSNLAIADQLGMNETTVRALRNL
jgi:DNA-binding NarL/FixJ family response regulator